MKKFFLSISVVAAFALYSFIRQGTGTTQPPVAPVSDSTPNTPQPTTPPQSPQTSAVQPTQPVLPTSPPKRGQYADGTFTGDTFDAFYGNVQVAAVITGGKITDVKVLQYPNDRSTSVEINSQAMPMLVQEAISSQTANVDIISGATDSSNAFIQSLGTALKKAV